MIYTLTINPAIDYAITLKTLNKGEINRSKCETHHYGGKGINVSTVLSRLGTPSTALGFIGGITGDELAKGLNEEGIASDFIRLETGLTRICVKITEADGTQTDINPAGPDITAANIDELMKKLDTLTCDDTLVLAGSVPSSVPRDIYAQICKKLFDKVRVVVDAAGPLLTPVLPYHPWLIKPNHLEAAEMCDKSIESHSVAEDCALQLRAMGASNVVISMAEKGAVLAAENGDDFRITAPKGKVICNVGAGDALLAGFLSGFDSTHDYRTALRYGIAAGTATAFTDGLCTKEMFDKVLSEVSYG